MAALQRSGKQDQINVKSEEEIAMADASEAERKQKDLEERKADVRRRLEEAGQKKNKKKGFLTPERKKKLRKLLMVKAAEDLKRQQLQKEQARQKALSERTIPMPEVDSVEDKGKLQEIYDYLWARVCKLEEEKWDINNTVTSVESTINSLSIEVNDLKGKYVKPSLKKVSKYDNKFKKMAENSAEKSSEKKLDFRSSLKVVKKDVMEEITNLKKKDDKPEWSKKAAVDTVVETVEAAQADNEEELEAVEEEIEA